jgi:ParB/RepB/Spo0J family partition protein
MQADGQLQPVVVRRVGEQWQLIAGERRWRAARLAGLERVASIERVASDSDALRLALAENLHREDLPHAERVAAIDTYAELVASSGLRQTARELRMDAGYLSRLLKMRRDQTIFPALEAGRLTFYQAHVLLTAPAAARRTLLDRVLREPGRARDVEIREWVQAARRELLEGQQRAVADVAVTVGDDGPTLSDSVAAAEAPSGGEPFERLLAQLREAPDPTSPDALEALRAMVALGQEMLARAEAGAQSRAS